MLRRAPRLLAGVNPSLPTAPNLLLRPPTPPSPRRLLASHHHAPTDMDAHHLLDETPGRTRASFIVRALRDEAPHDAEAVAALHCSSIKSGAVLDPPVRTSLLAAYARSRDVRAALALFHEAAHPDLILWNAAVSNLARSCHLAKAVALFRQMTAVLGTFDSTTVAVMLSAASRAGDMDLGTAIHAAAAKRGLDTELNLCNALVDMYAKCGRFHASEAVFWSMPCWDTASWNSMIGGSSFNGLSEVSARYFRDMARLAVPADEVTLSSVLSASARADDLFSFGKSVHGCVVKCGYKYAASCSVPNSLITFYSELGFPEDAEKVFLRIPNRNLVSWNAMVKGLVENEKVRESLDVFREMTSVFQPDLATLVTVISGCADQGLLCEGKEIHGYVVREGLLNDEQSCIGNSLLACSHSGLTDEGWKYYHLMSEKFGITPTEEHHVCMVDMLGRAGRLQDAHKFVESLPSKGAHGVWGALLSACSYTPELKMGESIAKHLLCLEPENSGYYVTISNLYAYQDMSCGAVQRHSCDKPTSAILDLTFRYITWFSKFIRWPMPEPELLLQWDLPAVKVPGADPPCDAKDAEQRSICTAPHSRAKEKQDRAVGMRQ
ncbi:hypothetical protein QYE76_057847 [Lolium multiflorum]|uniref:Pentatricopeptide repeat-containing protein n=1 Tax=Lolium multiflorum TaxID=4521 RepID=A0AAD8T4D0_LOLMU|nr:hypothetical protein QYE76_057847 [Lolium multiflorum]